MNGSGLPKTTTDCHRLPLTDWLYSIEHSNLSPDTTYILYTYIYISLTPPTTRAPLAVLKKDSPNNTGLRDASASKKGHGTELDILLQCFIYTVSEIDTGESSVNYSVSL